ncbi:MAG: hypothetical protein PHQ74_03490 [Crocinitomicaceae bacterium]|nr:hypothetical protein [Crocinitomicaceae bacterium]
MTYLFLKEELESFLLFATAPVYLVIVGKLQTENLKILAVLKNKKTTKQQKITLLKRLKKLKRITPLLMLIGLLTHVILYLIFRHESIRYGYFISMLIMYVIYVAIALINFMLRGAGILKHVGNFNGLPGN